MITFFDCPAFETFIADVCEQYEKTAPTVYAHANDLYERLISKPSQVSLAEVAGFADLREEGIWYAPNMATNHIYHLRHRLGMDTTGHAGF